MIRYVIGGLFVLGIALLIWGNRLSKSPNVDIAFSGIVPGILGAAALCADFCLLMSWGLWRLFTEY